MLLVEDDEIKTEVIRYFGRMNRRLDEVSNKQVPVCTSLTSCVSNLAVIDSTSGIKPPIRMLDLAVQRILRPHREWSS